MPFRNYRFHGETQNLDAARANAPGQFVTLPDGVTHYELAGPPEGQPVVLVHGFSVPSFIWDPTFTGLAEKGFRVVRYDLFGRGYSDRPDVVYDQALFARQLYALLDAVGFTAPINLAGLSMGGAIAVGFAAEHPERVRTLALLSPAGFPVPATRVFGIMRLPWVGEWLLDRFAEKFIVAGLARDSFVQEHMTEFADRYRVQMQYPGFKRALLSTLRHGPISTMAEAYQTVGKLACPVLLIWGRDDKTVPFAINEKVRAAIPRAEFHPIDNAGHIAHYEKPEVVNPLLASFFGQRI